MFIQGMRLTDCCSKPPQGLLWADVAWPPKATVEIWQAYSKPRPTAVISSAPLRPTNRITIKTAFQTQ